MPVETPADRAVFFNGADFGETILWTVGDTDPVAINVLPQAGSLMIDTQDGPDIHGQEATMVLQESDLPLNAARDDQVLFRAKHYLVKSIEPDGTGIAVVRLQEDF